MLCCMRHMISCPRWRPLSAIKHEVTGSRTIQCFKATWGSLLWQPEMGSKVDCKTCSTHYGSLIFHKCFLQSSIFQPNKHNVLFFQDFLKKEFSEENVLFWLACEDFKKSKDKKEMQKKAREIYTTFLSSKATSQVNVEGQSRISEMMLENPHPLMFQKLQEQIFNLMKYDSYSRFLKSETFLKNKASEENEHAGSSAGESAPKRASRIYNT
ncbi:regulator of G- signaling 10 isoform X1 [Pelobates cultripes]|uniref:Regulator of G- signaling 10 isoform X1 n=1 Tax=Pelobates cultripes TaxID=61616 RepID=A0AAD1TEY1_PELCU|nr:regulator of G- signaling 10 isoform X1 [Pelobates cultripes]